MSKTVFHSQGADQLKDWLATNNQTPTQLGAQLGVSAQAVYYWMRAASLPPLRRLRRIEEVTGIPVTAWTLAPGESQ